MLGEDYMPEKLFNKIIKEICSEEGITYELLSFNWIIKLEKDNKVRYITGKKFDINGEASGHIASDKYATFEVLKSFGIPVIEHKMIFNPKTRENWVQENIDDVIENTSEKQVVIKPNNGSEGYRVLVVSDKNTLKKEIENLFQREDSISICPFYSILREYRAYYLNENIVLIYEKEKPYVIGDGFSSLKELIEKRGVPNKKIVNENLKLLDLEMIPKKEEFVELSWKFNLSGGATSKILDKGNLYKKIENLALKVGHALNMKFATIDIIETGDHELWVLEVNSGISCDEFLKQNKNAYQVIKKMYKDAINEMFH